MKKKQLNYIFSICLCLGMLGGLFFTHISDINAVGTLTSMSVAQSSVITHDISDYTINFTTASAATLTMIDFQFTTTSNGTTVPANINLGSATLGTVTGMAGSWSIDLTQSGTGHVRITNTSGTSVLASTAVSVQIHNIESPDIGDCTPGATTSDTCYVQTGTIDNTGTLIDFGSINYNLQQPSFTFTVSGVASSTLTNGMTTTAGSTASAIPFGELIPLQRSFVAQKLNVVTNAPNGYTVYMKVSTQMQGIYYGSYISPFAATGAAWTSPVVWSDPTGTTNGTNTAWIGANTSDTRVANWSSSSNKFGPANGTQNPVMYSSTSDAGTNVYVTYGFESNVSQAADAYSGVIQYIAVPNY